MAELYLIRHGKTCGNLLGRYIGTTDESLCEEGRALLQGLWEQGVYPKEVEAVYASPLRRCVETARLIWPRQNPILNQKLRECDFGEFENLNYKELNGNPRYQAWVDSGGTLPFPGGESREAFQERCQEGFREVLDDLRKNQIKKAALVVHGGTIMGILGAGGLPGEGFYHWQVENGCGYRCLWDEKDERGVCLNEITPVGPGSGLFAGS